MKTARTCRGSSGAQHVPPRTPPVERDLMQIEDGSGGGLGGS